MPDPITPTLYLSRDGNGTCWLWSERPVWGEKSRAWFAPYRSYNGVLAKVSNELVPPGLSEASVMEVRLINAEG